MAWKAAPRTTPRGQQHYSDLAITTALTLRTVFHLALRQNRGAQRPGEWLVEKHGTSKRRSWRKPHIGFDAVTGRIVAAILTGRDVDDASQVGPFSTKSPSPVEVSWATAVMTEPACTTVWDERHRMRW